MRHEGVTLRFEGLQLVEKAETFIYRFECEGEQFFVETVAEPTARELLGAALSAWREGSGEGG